MRALGYSNYLMMLPLCRQSIWTLSHENGVLVPMSLGAPGSTKWRCYPPNRPPPALLVERLVIRTCLFNSIMWELPAAVLCIAFLSGPFVCWKQNQNYNKMLYKVKTNVKGRETLLF